MNAALLSSKNMEWCTPQDFFDKLDTEFHFTLDSAATEQTAKCTNFFTPETDGLSQSWDCGGAVFCNPPYGREIAKWVRMFPRRANAKMWRNAYPSPTVMVLCGGIAMKRKKKSKAVEWYDSGDWNAEEPKKELDKYKIGKGKQK